MDDFKELEMILETGAITSVFQPIISLKDASVIGYEALSRGPENSSLQFPYKLFSAAENHNKSWELESLCRVKALEKAKNITNNKLLFLNVDPLIFSDEKFKKGFTKFFLCSHNIPPTSIIFEITEKTAIQDYACFRQALSNYTDQGYQIAIDDTGAGYSGLTTLAEIKPDYVKIDISLIRDIHKDSFKQALIKALVTFAKSTNIKLIAEGIECEEELAMLIDLEVYAGQGYYIQKPASDFLPIKAECINFIKNQNKLKKNKLNYLKRIIGEICTYEKAFSPKDSCNIVKEYINHAITNGVCIVQDDKPVGLVMKNTLDSAIASQYGYSVFSKRPVSLVTDFSPLIVEYSTPVNEVSKLAMEREESKTYDCVVVEKDSKYYGLVTIKKLLEFSTKLERNYAISLNPLTKLPGNNIIEEVLDNLTTSDIPQCVLYFDLDNFKAYNDTYGFENGDNILIFTADLLQKYIMRFFPYGSFLGHIGGDDFICTIKDSFNECMEFCDVLLSEFDKHVPSFYSEEDRKNGFIRSKDRNGNPAFFNIISISIAGFYGKLNSFSGSKNIAEFTSHIKKESKAITGSSRVIKVF